MLDTRVWLYCTSSLNRNANALKLTCGAANTISVCRRTHVRPRLHVRPALTSALPLASGLSTMLSLCMLAVNMLCRDNAVHWQHR
jgi:hypothetical protein